MKFIDAKLMIIKAGSRRELWRAVEAYIDYSRYDYNYERSYEENAVAAKLNLHPIGELLALAAVRERSFKCLL